MKSRVYLRPSESWPALEPWKSESGSMPPVCGCGEFVSLRPFCGERAPPGGQDEVGPSRNANVRAWPGLAAGQPEPDPGSPHSEASCSRNTFTRGGVAGTQGRRRWLGRRCSGETRTKGSELGCDGIGARALRRAFVRRSVGAECAATLEELARLFEVVERCFHLVVDLHVGTMSIIKRED